MDDEGRLHIENPLVQNIENLIEETHKIEMVILCVPAIVAQYIVDEVVAAGIKAILNFAPINLRVPSDVYLRNENMSMELEYLSFAMVNNHDQKRTQ